MIVEGYFFDFEPPGWEIRTSFPCWSLQVAFRWLGEQSLRVEIETVTSHSCSISLRLRRLRLLRYSPTRSWTSSLMVLMLLRLALLATSRMTSIATLSAVLTNPVPSQHGQSS